MKYKFTLLVLVVSLASTECNRFQKNQPKQEPGTQGFRDLLSSMMVSVRRFLGFITTCYTATRYITITSTVTPEASQLVSDQTVGALLAGSPVLLNDIAAEAGGSLPDDAKPPTLLSVTGLDSTSSLTTASTTSISSTTESLQLLLQPLRAEHRKGEALPLASYVIKRSTDIESSIAFNS